MKFRPLVFAAFAGLLAWFVTAGITDRISGVSHESKQIEDSADSIAKLRSRYAEDMAKLPKSGQAARNESAAPREASKKTLPLIVSCLVAGGVFFGTSRLKPKPKMKPQATLNKNTIPGD
jgi:hypothetical protein